MNDELQQASHHEQEVQHQQNEHLESDQSVAIKTEENSQDGEQLQQVRMI